MNNKNIFLRRTLKLIFICIVITFSTIDAQTLHDVKIKTSSANISLEQVLKLIEQKTKFTFTYNKETLPLDKVIQLAEGELSLYEILYNLAKSFELTFHRISNQIVVKKTNGTEKNLVTDDENNIIRGKVIDSKTNEPLPYVSVYLSGTSIGTVTNEKGFYKIINIPSVKYNLVASIVGYEAKIVDIELKGGDDIKIDFTLESILYRFNQIDVSEAIPEKWRDQLKTFKKLFLGNNKFAGDCIIKNEYKINFYEDNIRMTADINEPLVIINNALGYKIECVLMSFEYLKKRNKTSCRIYPVFKEIIPTNNDSINIFILNRKEAYLGSLAHLLTTLADKRKNFWDEDFYIYYLLGRINIGEIDSTNKIVTYNPDTGQYFLKLKYNPRVSSRGFPDGLKIDYKGKISWINGIYRDGAEFDPGGFFINVGFVGTAGFIVLGEMAKEGMATQLPRFWKPPDVKSEE